MNFNSAEFMVFLTVVLAAYAAVFRSARLRDVVLLCASYFFYMSWNWKYAGLIAASTVVDYWISLRLHAEQRPRLRKGLLTVSVCMNLGILAVFKYYNFFIDLAGGATELFGTDISWLRHKFLLPIGISFYTFETLTYTVDVYKRVIAPERNLMKFALYLTFFPHLVAGPIVRAADFLPQLHRTPPVSVDRFQSGMFLAFQGLFKKVILADLLAGLAVDAVFADPLRFSSFDLLMALYGYAFQIYNDFSGYTDIARGVSKMFGFELPENFNRPYLAENVRDFWGRWHISLSTWLRDYLYIPLGGSRGTAARVRANLMITMLLGGLWHGAALNFLFWGGYHGALLCLAHAMPKRAAAATPAGRLANRFVCFHLIVAGWLLFRIGTWAGLVDYVQGLASFSGGSALSPLFYTVLMLSAVCHLAPQVWSPAFTGWWVRRPAFVQAVAYAGLILVFCGSSLGTPSFIYFQF
ncbi:MAG TPA: MBOAT family protein [Pirellulales bacterium]|nr:MBOAT family protein [Pirellulales bacterium]